MGEAFSTYMEKVEGRKVRERSPSFSDHFSQATLFWNSMADWERQHIVDAFSFELNMVDDDPVRSRVVNDLLANVDMELAKRVASNLGVALKPKNHGKSSPALSMDKPSQVIKGRKIAILAGPGVDGSSVETMKSMLTAEGAVAEVISRQAGTIKSKQGNTITVDRAAPNAPSVIYDAVFVPNGDHVSSLTSQGIAVHFVTEQFVHGKPIAVEGAATQLLSAAKIPTEAKQGVLVEEKDVKQLAKSFIDSIKKHRFFNRSTESYPIA